MDTIADLLRARSDDDHPGLLFADERWTWAEAVAEGAARGHLGRALAGRGPLHVGVLLDNLPEHLFWLSGAALSGAVIVGINPTRRGNELARDIRHTDCGAIVTDRAHLPLLDGLDHGVDPERIVLVDSPQYAEALRAARREPDLEHAAAPTDMLVLLFTSGSTGAPKAVICTSGRLAGVGQRAAGMFGITRQEVCYQAMPLFHGNALMASWAPALATGATVALRRRFSASGFLSDVRRFGATYFNYVGRALAYILATPPGPHDTDHHLRLGFGTEASTRDRRRFEERFGCRIVESYGSSEGAISMSPGPGAPDGSLGLPRQGEDVIVADPATGSECPRARFDDQGRLRNPDEAIGEIASRTGAGGFEGYYRNPEATAERVRTGWYWSGDLGYRDEQGWFYFAGRDADWLRVDSENFSAAPIERIIARHPDVVMAAVYPVPDPQTGDLVMASLELAAGATFHPEAFGTFLSQQADLGTKWAPRLVRIVAAMPLTASHKVSKTPLRSQAWRTGDPVWWQPRPGAPYRRLAETDRQALERELAENGRAHLLAPAGAAEASAGTRPAAAHGAC